MILPLKRETWVFESDSVILKDKLKKSLRKPGEDGSFLFTGRLKDGFFQIVRISNRPENFTPQVEGRFEETSTGCILFLKYTLQFSSLMFFVFWSVTGICFALFLWFIETEFFLGFGSVIALIFNLLVTHVNFHKQLKKTRDVLFEVLNK